MSLVDLFNEPRPADFAGRTWLVSPIRVGDIAYLESLALAMRGTGPPSWQEPGIDPPERRRRMRAEFNAVVDNEGNAKDGWLPTWGTPEVTAAVMGTDAGRRAYLMRVLREHALSDEQAGELDAAIIDDGRAWVALIDAANPPDPLGKIDRAIMAEAGITLPTMPGGLSLREAVASVAVALGKKCAELSEMTLAEVAFHLQGGKRPKIAHARPEDWTREQWRDGFMIPMENFWSEGREEKSPTASVEVRDTHTPGHTL